MFRYFAFVIQGSNLVFNGTVGWSRPLYQDLCQSLDLVCRLFEMVLTFNSVLGLHLRANYDSERYCYYLEDFVDLGQNTVIEDLTYAYFAVINTISLSVFISFSISDLSWSRIVSTSW